MTSDMALPFIAALIGVVSLFTDIKTKTGRMAAFVLGALLISACLFQIQQNYEEGQYKTNREKIIANLSEALRNFEEKTDESFNKAYTSLDEIMVAIRSFGNVNKNPTAAQIKESLEADKYRSELAEETNSSARSAITVQYFPKNVDGDLVENAIIELGFKLIKGEPGVPNVPTNAIWYGSQAPLSEVKLVATTLIRAGIEIKFIRPFKNSSGREQLIQVGSGTAYITYPTLTLSEIRDARNFPIKR